MARDGKDYEWMRDPFLLTPYLLNESGVYKSDALVSLYDRLKFEGLYGTVFHDNPDMGLFGFMSFFNSPGVLLQILNYVQNDKIVDVAALCWVVGVERYVDKTKAVASFVVFKDYQKPNYTSILADLAVGYWVNELEIDVVIGMTPALNKPAVRFVKRIGFEELCRIPGYTSLNGEICESVVTMMTKKRYQELHQGE